MKSYFLIPLLLLAAVAGCRSKGPAFNAYRPGPLPFESVTRSNAIDSKWLEPARDPYRLGPGDVIEVELIGEAGSRTALTLGPDGKIYYSLLPGLSVWGLTLSETGELLKNEIGKFTRAAPEAVVTLRTVASKRISILGAVGSPGVYTLGVPTTVLDAITAAGGVPSAGAPGDETADFSRSFVLREGRFIPVDFEALLRQGNLSQNIYLQPDDFVFLRPAAIPSIYVMGAVNVQSTVPYSKSRSLATTIIAAGGTQKYAVKGRVAIIRGGLTAPRIAEVDYQAIVTGEAPDVMLQPGDIVYVPFSPFRKVYQLAESIIDQFVSTIAVNEAGYIIYPDNDPSEVFTPIGGSGIR